MATTKSTTHRKGWRTYQARLHAGRAVEVLLQGFEAICKGDLSGTHFTVANEEADKAIALSGHRRVRRVK